MIKGYFNIILFTVLSFGRVGAQLMPETHSFSLTMNYDAHLKENYQKLSANAQMLVDSNGHIIEKEAQWEFVEKSKLPSELDYYSWVKNVPLDSTFFQYKKYISSYNSSQYLPFFIQIEGWLMITRYGMLDKIKDSSIYQVKYICEQFIDNKYKGIELLYYMINYLNENGIINNMRERIFLEKIKRYYYSDFLQFKNYDKKKITLQYALVFTNFVNETDVYRKYIISKTRNNFFFEKMLTRLKCLN